MWLRKFLHNYKIHLIIFFISVLLWFHVKTEKTYDQMFQVKIVPTNLNPESIITNQYTPTVNVQIRGKGKSLIALKNSDIEIQADLNQETQAHLIVRLNIKNILISTSLLDIQPLEFVDKDTIHFNLAALGYKKILVQSQISIQMMSGFIQIGGLELRPSEVTVSGPRSKVDSIDSLKTQSISFKNASNNITGSVNLVNPFPGKVVLSSQSVEYFMEIQKLEERLIENIPVQILNAPAGRKIEVEPPSLSLKIIGGAVIIKKVNKEAISAYIDYRRYQQTGEKLLPATIKIPDDVSFSEVFPQKFQMKIK